MPTPRKNYEFSFFGKPDSIAVEWLAYAAVLNEENLAYEEMMRIASKPFRSWLEESRAEIIADIRQRCQYLSYHPLKP